MCKLWLHSISLCCSRSPICIASIDLSIIIQHACVTLIGCHGWKCLTLNMRRTILHYAGFCMQIANDSLKIEINKIKTWTDDWSIDLVNLQWHVSLLFGTFTWKVEIFIFRWCWCAPGCLITTLVFAFVYSVLESVSSITRDRRTYMLKFSIKCERLSIYLTTTCVFNVGTHSSWLLFIFSFDWILSLHPFISLFSVLFIRCIDSQKTVKPESN